MPVLEQVLEQYTDKVKIAFKHYPLSNHAYAFKAAQAAVAAQEQGKFWPFHDLLFRQYRQINDRQIDEISKMLQMDIALFKKDMTAAHTRDRVNADLAQGRQIGIRGTPTVFIDGRVLNNKSLAGFRQAIDKALGP